MRLRSCLFLLFQYLGICSGILTEKWIPTDASITTLESGSSTHELHSIGSKSHCLAMSMQYLRDWVALVCYVGTQCTLWPLSATISSQRIHLSEALSAWCLKRTIQVNDIIYKPTSYVDYIMSYKLYIPNIFAANHVILIYKLRSTY